MSEVIEAKCPFCGKKCIKSLHTPESYKESVAYAASCRRRIPKLIKEKNEILVEKCPNCSKSKKEIEKALKHGKELPNEEVLKRLREAGLDPSKLK